MTVNFTDIERAHQRIAHLITRTPLLNSPRLDAIAGRRLWLKAEPLQVTGSFKFRGACSAISALSSEALDRGVIAYSSGNHAQGIALAAKLFKTRATIVMPHDAPANKVANTRAYGADVVHYERGVESREDIGADLARRHGLTLVKPYDDPTVIAGQGTVGLELSEQMAERKLSVSAISMLLRGWGFECRHSNRHGSNESGVTLYTAEPEGFDDTARSLSLGERVANEIRARSICDAIVTPIPGEITFPILKALAGGGFAVSDDQTLRAMRCAFDTLKLVIEPGGAVALRPLYSQTICPHRMILSSSSPAAMWMRQCLQKR